VGEKLPGEAFAQRGIFTSVMEKKLMHIPFLDLLTKVRIAVRPKASLLVIEIILESCIEYPIMRIRYSQWARNSLAKLLPKEEF
jgi:hypothetical protein